MAYEKPFLAVSDHAVGLQCVNRAIENNRALLKEQFDPGHAIGTGVADAFIGPGRHDDPLVARTVIDIVLDGTDAIVNIDGPMLVEQPTRLGTGKWQFLIATPQLVSAYAVVRGATAGVARYATCIITPVSTAPTGDTGPFVTVSTWNVSGGMLADYDFSLVLYAEGVY